MNAAAPNGAELHDSLSGNAEVYRLEWDSRLLAMECFRVKLAGEISQETAVKVRDTLRRKRAALADIKIATDDIATLAAFTSVGFRVIDTNVTIELKLGQQLPAHSLRDGVTIREAGDPDLLALTAINRDSFSDTTVIRDRFFIEPAIEQVRALELFDEWLQNSYRKSALGAGKFLVAEVNNVIAGFLTLEPLDESIWLDNLNAVSRDFRGRGIYSQLVRAAAETSQAAGASLLQTRTQITTTKVISTWMHLGGSIIASHYTLHWTP